MGTAVKMRVHISGLRDGAPWPGIGGIVDLPDREAEDMIRNGYAKAVEVEAAVAPTDKVETAAARTAPTRRNSTRRSR